MKEHETLPIDPNAPLAVASGDLFSFRWWYKGRTAEGNILRLQGKVTAHDASEACDKVEKQMRAEHPSVRWMQFNEIEGNGVTFGPTVQKLKKKLNAALCRDSGNERGAQNQ